MSNGWVKLHRQLLNHNLWLSEKFTKGQAWVDLILLANHTPNQIHARGIFINVNRGQVGYSEVNLALRWQWSRNKTRSFLNHLEKNRQIEQQKNNVTSIISIVNYDLYQSGDTPNDTSSDTPEGHQTIQQKDTRRYTNKNDNNDKNNISSENKVEKASHTKMINEEFEIFWSWLQKYKNNKNYATTKRKYQSLRSHFSKEDISRFYKETEIDTKGDSDFVKQFNNIAHKENIKHWIDSRAKEEPERKAPTLEEAMARAKKYALEEGLLDDANV